MTLLEQLSAMYLYLNTPQNSFYILLGFVAVALIALALRITVCVSYQTQLAMFHLNAKEIKTKSDIKETRSALLNRVLRDYLRTGDKGVAPRTAKNVVDKHINRMSILGWSYDGMASFSMGVERNIVFLGIILTVVFEEYRYVFAVCTVAVFLIMRLFATIFDFASAKLRLALELSEYVEREIGQFYAGDTGSIILRLKNELSAAILKQSETISDGIKKMGADISGVLRLSMQEMSKSIDATMLRVSDFGGELSEPLERWKKAVDDAAQAQSRFGASLGAFEKVSANLNTAASAMSENSAAVKEQISKLAEVAAGLQETSRPLFKVSDSIGTQLQYIERNQEILEKSLQRYELAMEDMTRKLGDGMGSIVEYHLQTSYAALNKALDDNIKQIVLANNELANRMHGLFEQIYEQGRSESQAVIKMKEQLDLHFEGLKQQG